METTTRTIASLFLTVIACGCSAAPDKPSDPLADHAEWQQANAEMERYIEETDLPETLDVPVGALKFVLTQKASRYGDVRERFASLYDTNDLTLRAAATLRVAQIDLNFACDLMVSKPPETLDAASALAARQIILEKASPMLERSATIMRQASEMGSNEYAKAAATLVESMPGGDDVEAVENYCMANRGAWDREQKVPFAARMRSKCELGIAQACYVAAEMTDDEAERKRLAARACDDGVAEACAIDGPPPGTAKVFGMGGIGEVPSTCEQGAALDCWKRAAKVDPEELQTYTDYCFRGNGYDCMRRGILLERGDALLDACALGAVPEASVIDDARAECDAGDAKACFQLGVATYTQPRELENARPIGMLGSLRGSAGLGSNEDVEEKIAACDEGDGDSCLRAAELVPREASDRVLYLDKACKLDQATGCHRWAIAILGNDNAPQSARKEAVARLQGACRDGVRSSCTRLAVIHGEGTDLPQSKVCAARYLFESCSDASPVSCLKFEQLLP